MTRHPDGPGTARPAISSGRPPRARRPRSAGTVPAVGLAVGLALLSSAGCGIRSTAVPVDAGAAPTRVSCAAPEQSTPLPRDGSAVAGKVYLVCSGRVLAVRRAVRLAPGSSPTDQLDVAQVLLDELRSTPGTAETEAGFSTDVPQNLRVSGPRRSDPATTLRLSQQPDELPSFALAQIVCTYAATAAAGVNRSVILGGPAEERGRPPLRYECGSALRSDPEVAHTAGVRL